MCGGTKNNDPRSKYECAGLIKDSGKTHCCLFNASDSKLKCEPLNNTEYGNLEEHTTKKKNEMNYSYLYIDCAENETIYCSNILLDQDSNFDCKSLKIYESKDEYCCRWKYKDKNNNHKPMDYCASINEFQYLNIKAYIKYKEKQQKNKHYYEDLEIDCLSNFWQINIKKYLVLIFFII